MGRSGTEEKKLSPRLQVIADYISPGAVLLDVGCDHALLPLTLLRDGKIRGAIGTDKRKGPLSGAEENARAMGLRERIDLRCCDGLEGVAAGEADTLVIAGMGGETMAAILAAEPEKTRSFRKLILEPQRAPEAVRKLLRSLGIRIADESMVKEEGKYYPVICCVLPGEEERFIPETVQEGFSGIQEAEDRFGPCLLAKKDPLLKEYLEKRSTGSREIIALLEKNGYEKSPRTEEIFLERRIIDAALGQMEVSSNENV